MAPGQLLFALANEPHRAIQRENQIQFDGLIDMRRLIEYSG